jgi:iron complex transport system substrate-binding protein
MTRTFARALAVTICACALHVPALADVVVRDDAGREVRLRKPAERVISLAPHATELLFEVHAEDAIVGATEYSDYPAAAKRLPRVGGLGSIDVERIVALKPDLVVAWRSGTPEAQLAAIERFGIAVFRSEPRSLDDIATSLERLGRLTGHADAGEHAATGFRQRIEALRATYARREPVRVFYQVWSSPLMTIGGPHVITSVIELCGGRNVFGSLAALAPTVDPEAVVARDPELIVTATGTHARTVDESEWSRWSGVAAVKKRRYLFIDPDLITRSTSRIVDGAMLLCRAIDRVRSER